MVYLLALLQLQVGDIERHGVGCMIDQGHCQEGPDLGMMRQMVSRQMNVDKSQRGLGLA